MGIVFATRGTNVATYSGGGATGLISGIASGVTVAADAGAISGTSIQWAANNSVKGVTWPGRFNTPNGRALSVLFRYRPGYTGAPTTTSGLFGLTAMSGKSINLTLQHSNTTGNLTMTIVNESAGAVLTTQSFGAWSPTSGTWYDIVFTWDGTTTANACKIYVDGTLLGQATAGAAFSASWTNEYFSEIMVGCAGNQGGTINAGRVDEFILWDSVITPTSVTLDSGTGSLNGASRTSPVTVSAFNGLTYSFPTAGQIQTGVAYTNAGVAGTGTYDGSDRWSDPGEANVALGVAYKANSTSNNKTGTYVASCDYPDEDNVLYGTSYASGTKTGTYGSGPPAGSWAPQQTQYSIFNALKDDVTLCTLLGTTQGGTQKVFDYVPQGTAFPYVVMQINPWEDRGNYTLEGLKSLLTIHVWYQPGQNSMTGHGDKQVQLIQKRIDEILHKSTVAISGFRNLVLRRAMIDIVVDPDNVTRHGIQQFKLFIGG